MALETLHEHFLYTIDVSLVSLYCAYLEPVNSEVTNLDMQVGTSSYANTNSDWFRLDRRYLRDDNHCYTCRVRENLL